MVAVNCLRPFLLALSCDILPCDILSCRCPELTFHKEPESCCYEFGLPGLVAWAADATFPSEASVNMSLERKETNVPKGKDLCMWQMAMTFQRAVDPMLKFRSGFNSLSPVVTDWLSLVAAFTRLGLHFHLSRMGMAVATFSPMCSKTGDTCGPVTTGSSCTHSS